MGTWGPKPFENDAALDFIGEFETVGWKRVATAINRALGKDDFHQQQVIAAAEFIAYINGHPARGSKEICDPLTEWANENLDFQVDQKLTDKAIKKVSQIRNKSELLTAWEDGDEPLKWVRSLDSLVKRLAKPPRKRSGKSSTRKQSGKTSSKAPSLSDAKRALKSCGETYAFSGRRLVTLNSIPNLVDAKQLAGIPKVNVLEVGGCDSDSDAQTLSLLFSFWPEIDGLNVEKCKSLSQCGKALAKMKRIDTIALQESSVSNDVIDGVSKMKKLKDVSIIKCGLSAKQLQTLIKSLKNLEQLCIEENHLTLSDCQSACKLEKLEQFLFKGKGVTAKSAKSFFKAKDRMIFDGIHNGWACFESR